MKNEDLDFLYTDFLEELANGDYLLHENDGVWMHGKVFKTNFIRKNNIHYNLTRVNEDHAFNIITGSVEHKSLYVDYITYVWKYNTDSITRSCDSRALHMNDFLINAKFTIDEMLRLKVDESKIIDIAKNYIINLYANYVVLKFQEKSETFLAEYISNVSEFYRTLPKKVKESLDNKTPVFYGESMYRDPIIQKIIENSLLLSPSFDEYFSTIK